ALFEVPRSVLVRFLRRTYVVVPRGRESDHLDVDTAVTRLLAGR
ncbi:MAG TPA: SsgA family sporulation/cell division regulator, partial [Micromonosporaceae bacterium]|nr:SsgA family sporulation/cell division regulator [Micromonosporaceae bacterium]